MRRERPKVHEGDMRDLAVVRQIETAASCSSSWEIEHVAIARNSLGGRPKRRR
jgi:hypothetical protein